MGAWLARIDMVMDHLHAIQVERIDWCLCLEVETITCVKCCTAQQEYRLAAVVEDALKYINYTY